MERVEAVRVGSRWAAVVDYGQQGGTGSRQGCWCEDAAGGWGIGSTPEGSVAACSKPVLYASRMAALEAHGAAPDRASRAAALLGRKGGQAGTGASKRRQHTTPEHMRAIRARAVKYERIPASEVPQGLRWDVPRQNQGQIVEVAYADYPTCRSEAARGSAYERATDQSEPIGAPERVLYYRRTRR
jgi:hypothetical protein